METDRVDESPGSLMRLAPVLHDGTQLRQLVPDTDDLLQLMIVLDNNHLATSGDSYRSTRFRRVGRIDARRKTTETHQQFMILQFIVPINNLAYYTSF